MLGLFVFVWLGLFCLFVCLLLLLLLFFFFFFLGGGVVFAGIYPYRTGLFGSVREMKCMQCAQTRPRFILSSESVLGYGVKTHADSKGKSPRRKRESKPRSLALEVDALSTRPTRRSERKKELKRGSTSTCAGYQLYWSAGSSFVWGWNFRTR